MFKHVAVSPTYIHVVITKTTWIPIDNVKSRLVSCSQSERRYRFSRWTASATIAWGDH